MSRRTFIRWMIALLFMIGAAVTALVKLLQKAMESHRAPDHTTAPQKPVSVKESDTGLPEEDPDAAQFSYMILSDPHISTDVPSTTKKLKDALEDMKQFGMPMEAIVITGDLTEYGREKEYEELYKILSAYPLPPVYANMGNHDYYDIWIDRKGAFNQATMPNGKTDWQSRERFQTFFGLKKPYHDGWLKGHHLIMLSQETYVQERPEVGEGAWYSDEQLDWLEQQLAAHTDGKPVFIMTHQPLPPAGQDGRTHQLIRANKFREIVKPYKNVFVFCGHRHHDFQGTVEHYVKENFHYFHNSSVGRVLNRSYQHVDKEKSQGLFVQVYKDRVTLRGREFSNRTWIKEADWTVKLV
ncbi:MULTISPECIES: metallophosphoesterase [unclassified Paenibacillus]|uniref:metallophosphoesterase family protein n=1 Tax=unclassified Paenibacillus TaxID=185978 RepID=UPI001AE62AD5|nr:MULTISPECIES: metallophosphoesterase [unclassified Paenibacillus]MBP1157079.1 3',5'-cyclic AMP phosphodiesterase CpdA [Paenibacillus sp. PvP091]MBP1172182.1 3',5'-cyclic AMP phosphodiesterase CpdA [Paenibacillus sp. PvR098]MBP2438563.1 3',5'-cyclic AMP phosphodiesterase CpdA [Paenibacillus sp. PvP052]